MSALPTCSPASSFLRGKLWCVPLLLVVAACDSSNSSAPAPGVAADPIVTSTDSLPGVVITIEGVRGKAGAGRAAVGDFLTVDFTVKTDAGAPLELSKMTRGGIMVSGPTSNYQRVIASQADLLAKATKRALGAYSYTFAVAIPATYLAPLNDTNALTEGELTGQPLLDGTYTVGMELRKDYSIDGVTYPDPGNAAANFLIGNATTLQTRELVTLANCNQCHTEVRVHGENRTDIANCVLCHTAGSEDKNVAAAANGTPGVSIDFKVMIHKIHSGKHLPSVLGVTTNPDGTRNYAATAQPYQVVGYGNTVHDFSAITWPAWPSFYTPMPRDTGHSLLSSTLQSRENTMRQGPAECYKCHGDPDGDGPLPAPAQGEEIWSRPTTAACQSCHDDWNPSYPYTANLQTMPAQGDNSACTLCHQVEGTPLDVKTAHQHPLVDPAVATGVVFDVQSVTDVGNANGKFEPGEKVQVTFQVKNNAGALISPSALSRMELIVSGPTTNPQIMNYQRVAQNYFTGTGPFTFKVPELVFYEPIGVSDGSLNTFTTGRAPLWNVTNAATTLLRRTGTGAVTTLTANAAVTQNYIDVASSTGFAKDNFIVIDDAVVGLREYMKVQWVNGTRIWFSSQFRQTYKPNLKLAHATGATVQVITTAAVTSGYSVDPVTGIITETSEIGLGEILASYTTDWVIPAVYPGALDDSPVNGENWGDWTGLPLVAGTYVLDIHGAKSLVVTRSGENTTYTEGADSTGVNLLFKDATAVETVSRIDPQSCYGCHENLQFHGGSRRSVEACLSCHGTAGAELTLVYENQTSGHPLGSSVEFRNILHVLHNGVFPDMRGGVQDCAKCHGDNDAWKLPASRLHPNQSVPTRAWMAACSSCHSDSAAMAHIDANTSAAGAEACSVCHGADDELNVEAVHKIK